MATYNKADELAVRLLALNTGISIEDARVMWAGPELLEALKDAVNDLRILFNAARNEGLKLKRDYKATLTKGNAAIAKAEAVVKGTD